MVKLTTGEAASAYATATITKYVETADETKGIWISTFTLEGAQYSVRLTHDDIAMSSNAAQTKALLLTELVTNVDKIPAPVPSHVVTVVDKV